MNRRETIVELARTLRDVTPSVTGSGPKDGGRPGHDSGLLQETTLYRQGSYRHLELALDRMRRVGEPVARWRWHFSHRYLRSDRKALPARTRGSNLLVLVDDRWSPAWVVNGQWQPLGDVYSTGDGGRWVNVERWRPDVRLELVESAVVWLDDTLPPRLWLPDWTKAA